MNWNVVTIGVWNCKKGFSRKKKRLRSLLRNEATVDIWLLQGVPSVQNLCSDMDEGWGIITPPAMVPRKLYDMTDTVILYKLSVFELMEADHVLNSYGEKNWLWALWRAPRVRYRQTAVFRSKNGLELAVANLNVTEGKQSEQQVESYLKWGREVCKDPWSRRCVIGGSWGQRGYTRRWGEIFWRELRMVFAHVQTLQVTGYEDIASNMKVISRREAAVREGSRAIVVRYKFV